MELQIFFKAKKMLFIFQHTNLLVFLEDLDDGIFNSGVFFLTDVDPLLSLRMKGEYLFLHDGFLSMLMDSPGIKDIF